MQYKTVPAMPDIRFSAIGFGCWSLGGGSGWRESSDAESIATIHRALDLGVTLLDTAEAYGQGRSEGHARKPMADGGDGADRKADLEQVEEYRPTDTGKFHDVFASTISGAATPPRQPAGL